MAEAGKFHLSLFEWTTPERLFNRLTSILGSEDAAGRDLTNTYRTAAVKSARVPLSPMGHLWEEAQINAPEFCQANKLIMWRNLGTFSIGDDNPLQPRWAVFFSLKDASANWPSLCTAPAPAPKKGLTAPLRRRGRKPDVVLRVEQAMRDEIARGKMTREELRTMIEKSLETRFGASRDTCRKARITVLSEFVENSISDNLATNDK